jgi:hypothetical protein
VQNIDDENNNPPVVNLIKKPVITYPVSIKIGISALKPLYVRAKIWVSLQKRIYIGANFTIDFFKLTPAGFFGEGVGLRDGK